VSGLVQVRFMLLDVVEQRLRGWETRLKKEGPKKIEVAAGLEWCRGRVGCACVLHANRSSQGCGAYPFGFLSLSVSCVSMCVCFAVLCRTCTVRRSVRQPTWRVVTSVAGVAGPLTAWVAATGEAPAGMVAAHQVIATKSVFLLLY
jgi:hypothetical protein